MFSLFAQGLLIDWEKIHLYNSLMALMAGIGFLTIWKLLSDLKKEIPPKPKLWAINLGIIGSIVFICGMYTNQEKI